MKYLKTLLWPFYLWMMTMINHLYVHVPFCKSICYYCDFCHNIYNKELITKWLDALQKEIENECKDQYKTIYIGGGTPNSLDYEDLNRLLSIIEPYSKKCAEYTIELNPECFNIKQIELFKKYGIRRFSIGLQTSIPSLLKTINRKHSFEDVYNLVETLRNNDLYNISIDLMYSLPGQTMDGLKNTLEDVVKVLEVPHISIYSLTIEENSVFGKKGINHLDDDIEADMYEYIVSYLKENGYIHYEVSNFAKEGYKSRHNIGYWNYDDYLGVSLSATSKIGNRRYTNTRSFDKYFESYMNKEEELNLTNKDLIIENLMMSLRTDKGLLINDFNNKYSIDFDEIFAKTLDKYKNDFIRKDYRLICNNRAILNTILADFLLELDDKYLK